MISEGYKTYVKERINEYILENDKLPSKNDIEDIILEPIIGEYGSWKNVLIHFGFLKSINCDEMFEELLKLQSKLNHPLRMSDIRKERINIRPLLKKFGTWGKLKQELIAHLPVEYQKKKMMNEDFLRKIIEEENKLKQLTKKYNKIPTAKLARDNNVNINSLLLKYKTWNQAKRDLKLENIIERKN